MSHLVRMGTIIAAILLFVFLGARLLPIPSFAFDLGFHPKDSGANEKEWTSLPVQYLQSSLCSDCHQEEYALWSTAAHQAVSCENCHGPARFHLETMAPPIVDTSKELCATCHTRLTSRPAKFPQVDIEKMAGESTCTSCHNPHEPRAGMPPQVPHGLEGRQDCQSCHAPHEPIVEKPPLVPHTLEGRADCLACHGSDELRGMALPRIPHTLEGRANCLMCHSPGGLKPVPADHAGRTGATCLNCHRSD